MWTENWSGWFSSFGDHVPYRPAEDVAFAVAHFYQLGGTFQNYYMYHGGTNIGRSTGGPFITTSYDYDAPVDEYGSGKGSHDNREVSIDVPISLIPRQNKIDLLSLTVGLQNYGAHFDTEGAGVTGHVWLKCLQNGSTIDLSSQYWTYQIGLKGEDVGLFSGSSSLWVSQPTLPKNQPLVWDKEQWNASPRRHDSPNESDRKRMRRPYHSKTIKVE